MLGGGSALRLIEAFAFGPCVSMVLECLRKDYSAVRLELISDELHACAHCGY